MLVVRIIESLVKLVVDIVLTIVLCSPLGEILYYIFSPIVKVLFNFGSWCFKHIAAAVTYSATLIKRISKNRSSDYEKNESEPFSE